MRLENDTFLAMATPFENVVEQALSLSAGERLRLATELLESAEPSAAREEVELAWEHEIQRRITEIDSGNAKGRAWDDIKREFAAALSSEAALSDDWNRPEEDAAWAHLQPDKSS